MYVCIIVILWSACCKQQYNDMTPIDNYKDRWRTLFVFNKTMFMRTIKAEQKRRKNNQIHSFIEGSVLHSLIKGFVFICISSFKSKDFGWIYCKHRLQCTLSNASKYVFKLRSIYLYIPKFSYSSILVRIIFV